MEEQWWYAIAVANSDVMIVKHGFRTSIAQVQIWTGSELAAAVIYRGS